MPITDPAAATGLPKIHRHWSDRMAAVHPDAELLSLGAELDRAWAQERATFAAMEDRSDNESAELMEAAYKATSAVVRQIEGLRAATLEGLHIKARAALWCHNGDPAAFDGEDDLAGRATDTRLCFGIVGDLIAMGGQS
jgi:hypothetical protein